MGPVFSPLDEELGLLPGALTPSLQEDVVRLSTWMPFAHATSELARMRGVTVSETTVRQRTEAAGAAYAAVQTAQAAAIVAAAPDPPAGPARQLLSADGTMVPLVGGQWTEAKTLVVGEIGAPVWEHGAWVAHSTDLSYVSRVTDAATFTQLATVETQRRGTATAGMVCAVMDGAEWLQGLIDEQRPDAVRILDFPHAAGYLAQVAAAVWADDPAQQTEWLTTQCHALKHEPPAVVLGRLRALAATLAETGGSAAVQGTVRSSLAYLEKRQDQVRYAAFQAAGYPIASGAVESAHTVLCGSRLCGAGMHWALLPVNAMLALRTLAANDRWDEAWPQITTQVRQQVRQRAASRRAARVGDDQPPAAVSPPPPAEPDLPTWRDGAPHASCPPASAAAPSGPRRPAATHPWRRPVSRRPAA